MSKPCFVQLLLCLCVMAMAVEAQIGKICYWWQFRAAVVQDALYIDGGQLYRYNADGLQVSDFGNGSLYYLNFSAKFDTSTDNLTELFLSTPKASGDPSYYEGSMFADDFELFTYGGLPNTPVQPPYPPSDFISGYKVYEDDPTVAIPQLGPEGPLSLTTLVTRFVSNGAGVSVPSERLGFYFSGMHGAEWGEIDDSTPQNTSDSLIQVDMKNLGDPTWRNNTFVNQNPAVVPRANAELIWIPVSTQGALIAIGGVINPESLFSSDLSEDKILASENTSPLFMKSVPVYDIANDVWYVQETTGPYPGQLAEFCSVVTSENGSSSPSFDIHIYGGYNGLRGQGYQAQPPSDDIWVLSIPSFTWTQVHQGNSSRGRYGHFCTAPYPDQMWVVGGVSFDYGCLDAPVIEVFNLSSSSWQAQYDPTKWSFYTRPSAVAEAIKANPTPTSFDPDLAKLLSADYSKTTQTYYPYAVAKTNPNNSGNKWEKPVIAAVVSVVGVLAIIIFTCIFCRRRKRTGSKATSEVQPYGRVFGWMNGIPKTGSSVTTTTEVDDSGTNPFGGFYEVDGDFKYRNNAPPPQAGFAEVSVGTRRTSQPGTLPSRPPLSPQPGSVEVDGEERYEMQGMDHRGSSQSGDLPTHHFKDHPLYPRSIDDSLDRAAGQPLSSKHQSSYSGRSSGSHGLPSPYLAGHAAEDMDVISQGVSEHTSPELAASPVERRPSHLRNVSSLSSRLPTVSPHNEHESPDLDEMEMHSGLGFDASPNTSRRMRPKHTRNVSSLSSGLSPLPSPAEEAGTTPTQERRPMLSGLGLQDDVVPAQEPNETKPLMGAGEVARQNAGSPMNARMSLARKPVSRGGRVSAFSEVDSFEEGRENP